MKLLAESFLVYKMNLNSHISKALDFCAMMAPSHQLQVED
jgi:hypothetical protein